MSITITETGSVSRVRQWVYGLWAYYRQYTQSAIHAASAAALTIFGLLVFIDPLFAGVAIAAYVCPPLVLYVLGVDVGSDTGHAASTNKQTREETAPGTDTVFITESSEDPESGEETDAVSSDSESDDGDTDSDSDDGDTDSDSDDGDTDSDSDDGDTDSDSDDGDTDSDSDDGDTDSDSDNEDTDTDGSDTDTDNNGMVVDP